jgi:hypothetical protein
MVTAKFSTIIVNVSKKFGKRNNTIMSVAPPPPLSHDDVGSEF